MRATTIHVRPESSSSGIVRQTAGATFLILAAGAVLGCSKGETSSSGATSGTRSDSSAMAPQSTASSELSPVRGTIASVTDSMLTVSSDSGPVRVAIVAPLDVYARVPAKLSDVKENTFVGVTSVAQPDGSQRATEIHIFPDKLRGTGEGSYLMTQQAGASGGNRSTMTNGTVTAPRMTNGSISAQSGGKLIVQYKAGTQTITVPPNVSVTAIAPSQAKLTPGSRVIVLAARQPDGTLKASAAMLADTTAKAKQAAR
jgi:hypothetical protein